MRSSAFILGLLALAACAAPPSDAGTDAAAMDAEAAGGPDGAAQAGPDAAVADAGLGLCAALDCSSDVGGCLAAPLPAGTVCRAAAGECDEAEICDGVALDCPGDRLAPKATLCGNVSWCTGESADCPPGAGEWKVFPEESWYWSSPRPQGRVLYGVRGTGPEDVWAVGAAGTILHWDGRAWEPVPSGTVANLARVWAIAPDDAWAVGKGALLHWDGVAWSPKPTEPTDVLVDVWGSAANDVWVCGGTGSIGVLLHWDGVAWQRTETNAGIVLLSGTAPDDVWAAGGELLHWDGSAWTDTGKRDALGLKAVSRNDVWLTTWKDYGSTLQHWDGSGWTDFDSSSDATIAVAWATGPDDVWVEVTNWCAIEGWPNDSTDCRFVSSVRHWDGSAWSERTPLGQRWLSGFWGSSQDEVWAVGTLGAVFRWDGQRWASASEEPLFGFNKVWGSAADNVWVGGVRKVDPAGANPSWESRLQRWDGSGWVRMSPPSEDWYGALCGSGADDVWLGGATGGECHLDRWNGSTWATEQAECRGSVVKTRRDEAWGVRDESIVERWDGTQWSQEFTLPERITRLAAASPTNLWAMSDQGTLFHWDGVGTSATSLSAPAFPMGVWPEGESGVWVGCIEKAARWDGAAWTVLDLPGHMFSSAIWGDADEAWVGGSDYPSNPRRGFLVHCKAGTCQETSSPAPLLKAMWGDGPNDVWAVGVDGTILHRR